MPYNRFLIYNVLGGVMWVTLFLSAGFLFGNLPLVRAHFSLITYAIIVISLVACAGVLVKELLARPYQGIVRPKDPVRDKSRGRGSTGKGQR